MRNFLSHDFLFDEIDVYVRFAYEEDAGKAVDDLNNRFYAGRPLYTELSPVTDFGEGTFLQLFLFYLNPLLFFFIACC